MKKVIIIGATSGIGKELAMHYACKKCKVGITGRRTHLLDELKAQYPDFFVTSTMDITHEDCLNQLQDLITELGGMDLLIINSGVGYVNNDLNPSVEIQTATTNVKGFTQLITFGFNYFKEAGIKGHIAATSSIAGTKGLRMCPAYSATKRYQAHYIECLAQKAKHDKLNIKFTTILPGFIDTDFIKGNNYPLLTSVENAGRLIFRAIEKQKRKAYVPIRWRFVVCFWKMIPNWIWERCF